MELFHYLIFFTAVRAEGTFGFEFIAASSAEEFFFGRSGHCFFFSHEISLVVLVTPGTLEAHLPRRI